MLFTDIALSLFVIGVASGLIGVHFQKNQRARLLIPVGISIVATSTFAMAIWFLFAPVPFSPSNKANRQIQADHSANNLFSPADLLGQAKLAKCQRSDLVQWGDSNFVYEVACVSGNKVTFKHPWGELTSHFIDLMADIRQIATPADTALYAKMYAQMDHL